NAAREEIGDRDFERDGEDVEASEDVLGGPAAASGNSPEVVAGEIDQIEDALFVELIGVVELAGDDAPAVRQRLDVAVDERLVVEAVFAAHGAARVVTGEGSELVDQTIGLRTVVIRQNGEVLAENHGARGGFVSAGDGRVDPGHSHGLRAAGELPQD